MRRLHATQGRMQVLWEQVATPAQLPTTEQAQQEGTSEDIQQTQPQVLLTRDGPHMLPAKRVATPTQGLNQEHPQRKTASHLKATRRCGSGTTRSPTQLLAL